MAENTATLPPELERHIFELAALSRPVSIPHMMRVAWRIKQWVQPLLFLTLVFGCDSIDGLPVCDVEIIACLAQHPDSILDAARNVIAFLISPAALNTIIQACPRIENLFMLPTGALPAEGLSAFDDLPLKHLHASPYHILDLTSATTVLRPPFLYITHLELCAELDREDDNDDEALARWMTLASLPKLSHLALNSNVDMHVYVHLLAACKALHALILLRGPPRRKPAEMDILIENPRFVMMLVEHYTADWQRGVLLGNDFWARADLLIAKRISGEVDRRAFLLADTS
ncbi:hypothetical protein C8R45DRAFT_435870 [Mycena sanguinolenta]|nr:hypothetical protein C8R45DRAFT_435870 [Mycena sanguinolenta]